MSQYSEIMGSFVRTGNYPLEANYIFSSEEELKEFYSDEINKSTLHNGLLKIVITEEQQILYWIVDVEGEQQFKPLIQANSLEELETKITDLKNSLDQEITTREEAILDIIGTSDKSDFQDQLDNLLSISNAVIDLQNKVKSNSNNISAIVGKDVEDIISYLSSLNYGNLTKISNFLKSFFGSLESIPDVSFKTLQGIYDFVLKLASRCANADINLQHEINQTQTGVGLDQNGLFSPDQETNYLKNSTSVMNALKTLDSLVNQALNMSSGVKDAYYDSDSESLVINFILHDGSIQETIIPVSTLISEWEVDNTKNGTVVVLTRERVQSGGPDKLSADVRISEEESNILEKVGNKLIVRGISSNITHNGESLKDYLDQTEWYEG